MGCDESKPANVASPVVSGANGVANNPQTSLPRQPSQSQPSMKPKPQPRPPPPKPVDSTSSASYVNGGGGGGGDDLFGSLAPKKKERKMITLPKLVPGDSETNGSGDSRVVILEGITMTIGYKIMVTADESSRSELQRVMDEVFTEIDTVFNNWNMESEVSRLNAAPAGAPGMLVSNPLFKIIKLAFEISKFSGGRFDITVGPLWKLWRDQLEKGKVPTVEAVASVAASVGYTKSLTLTDDGHVIKKHPNVSLDLGGICKGLAVDMLVERLNESGFENVLVDWGGEIRASGSHPAGRPWRTSVLAPPELDALFDKWKAKKSPGGTLKETKMLGTFDLSNRSIATSGDYFQVQKFGYFHIVEPRSRTCLKASSTSIASVSVISKSCAVADALATAAMTFDSDEGARDFLHLARAQIPGVQGYLVFARSSPAVFKDDKPNIDSTPSKPTLPARLREVMRTVPLAVAVVSIGRDSKLQGTTIDSVGVCVVDESSALVSFNVMQGSILHRLVCEPALAGEVGIPMGLNLLGTAQDFLADRFAGTGIKSQFDGIPHIIDGPTGVPLLAGVYAAFICTVKHAFPAGDHTVLVLNVDRLQTFATQTFLPLLWFSRKYRVPSPALPLDSSATLVSVARGLPLPVSYVYEAGSQKLARVDGFTMCSMDPPLVSFSFVDRALLDGLFSIPKEATQIKLTFLCADQHETVGAINDAGNDASVSMLPPNPLSTLTCTIFKVHDLSKCTIVLAELICVEPEHFSPAQFEAGSLMW
eukprot:CAMPEP_0184659684 /NCGR_PEP_ID=MMETSP0308-20130426/30656_1 /TAXON_ID=38269 /ORGANISM="Gloeochaete witrockiana, Strain SAG 46.84" /LENGTH=761 /DNA_ID=CAMNT_0027099703 /DNA_START=73 /DNA_END=2355 /DNA_ORIENTATION=-